MTTRRFATREQENQSRGLPGQRPALRPMPSGRVIAAVALLILLTAVPSRAQFTTAVVDPKPVPCALQAGAPLLPPDPDSPEGDLLCDVDGLIVHKATDEHPYGDGGDTAQREGWYWLGVWIRQHTPGLPPFTPRRKLTFDDVIRLLEPNQDGVFYRHPKLSPWNNPYDKKFGFSRDQMEPLVAAMGVWGRQDALRRLWDALPEDALGKHSFNGSYKNALGQDGWDCSEIERRDCDATRDCSLKVDTRDCSLQTDTRDCSLQEDTRNCGYDVCIFGICTHFNDPICELAKATQNAIYKANKDACEAAKAAQNLIYAGEKAACEAAKATQNAIYVAEKDACEVAKAGEKAACEADKTVQLNLCRASNYHDGDFIGPMTENLFSRAMNESLSHSLGEPQLFASTLLRISQASDRDDTGDDLNLIVKLLMAKLRSPSAESEAAVAAYASFRPFSYGSYLATYRAVYGPNNPDDMRSRISEGIQNGWKADKPPVNGAVHWYHRRETGGNQELAELYDPIIDRFIYGDQTGTFSTSAAVKPAPSIGGVTSAVGSTSGRTQLTIKGSNFHPQTTVLINGTPATDVVVINSTTIVVETPAVGKVNVSVTVAWPGGGTASVDVWLTPRRAPLPAGDFDGDGRADVGVYRPNGGTWFLIHSADGAASGVPWGNATDVPVHGDYDGDGKTDHAVYRAATGTWYVLLSTTGSGMESEWGVAGDVPVPADYDGDGRTDIAVYRPSSGVWYIVNSSTNTASGVTWGQEGDVPVPADFDGDGKADPTVYRESSGTWYQLRSTTGSGYSVVWGAAGDIPIAADFDGDGKADPTVFRESSGTWYQLRSTTGSGFGLTWGAGGDVPIAGDYDGDGKADPAVFRPSTNTWYQLRSTTGAGVAVLWGAAGDLPM